jgi:hypothetical protein
MLTHTLVVTFHVRSSGSHRHFLFFLRPFVVWTQFWILSLCHGPFVVTVVSLARHLHFRVFP